MMINTSKIFNYLLVCTAVFLHSCVSTQQLAVSPHYSWVKDSSNHFYFFVESKIFTKNSIDSLKEKTESSFEKIIRNYQGDNFFPHKRMSIFVMNNISLPKLYSNFNESFYEVKFGTFVCTEDTIGVISRDPKESYILVSTEMVDKKVKYNFMLSLLIQQTLRAGLAYVFKSDEAYSFAMYGQDGWRNNNLHDLAAHIYKNNVTFGLAKWCRATWSGSGNIAIWNINAFKLGQYSGRFTWWGGCDEIVYPLTASLYKYIFEHYGIEEINKWKRINTDEIDWQGNQKILEWEGFIKTRIQSNQNSIDTIKYVQRVQARYSCIE